MPNPSNLASSQMNREDQEGAYRKDPSPFWRLMRYFRPVLPLLLLGLALAGAANLANLAKPFVLQHILDDYITVENFDLTAVTLLGALYFVVVAAAAGAQYAQSQVSRLMGQKIVHRMRVQLSTIFSV